MKVESTVKEEYNIATEPDESEIESGEEKYAFMAASKSQPKRRSKSSSSRNGGSSSASSKDTTGLLEYKPRHTDR